VAKFCGAAVDSLAWRALNNTHGGSLTLCGRHLNINKIQSTDIGGCGERDSGKEARLGQSLWEDAVPTFKAKNEINTTTNQKEAESMKVSIKRR